MVCTWTGDTRGYTHSGAPSLKVLLKMNLQYANSLLNAQGEDFKAGERHKQSTGSTTPLGLRRAGRWVGLCWSHRGGHCCPRGHPTGVSRGWPGTGHPLWRTGGPRGFWQRMLGHPCPWVLGVPLFPISLSGGFGLWQCHLLLHCPLGTLSNPGCLRAASWSHPEHCRVTSSAGRARADPALPWPEPPSLPLVRNRAQGWRLSGSSVTTLFKREQTQEISIANR